MADSYKEITKRQWDEIPIPQVLPLGSYLLKLRGVSYRPARSDDSSPMVSFGYNVVEPMSDVEETELAKLGEDYDYAINKVYATFWVDDDGDWQKVRKHLVKHGIDTKGMTLQESFKAARGAVVVAYLEERTYTDNNNNEVTENTPTNFVAAE